MTSTDTDFTCEMDSVCLDLIDFFVDARLQKQLHVIEWNHLNLWKFYPMALATSWSVRCLLYPVRSSLAFLLTSFRSDVRREVPTAAAEAKQRLSGHDARVLVDRAN